MKEFLTIGHFENSQIAYSKQRLFLFIGNIALESRGINATDDVKLATIFDHHHINVIVKLPA